MKVRVRVRVAVIVTMAAGGFARAGLEMDIEFYPGDAGLLAARDVEVIAFQAQVLQFQFQLAGVGSQIKERPDQHVAADAAGQVKVEGLHLESCARALIWLAA